MDPESVRRNLERVREQIGPDIEILAATKYVPERDLPALAEAGIALRCVGLGAHASTVAFVVAAADLARTVRLLHERFFPA